MRIIDFHAHILPEIDDGSEDITTSVKMMEEERRQGITDIILTPHFYANRTSLHAFLQERQRSFEALQAVWTNSMPCLHLASETAYFDGIGRTEELDVLCMGQTPVLMLEMPFTRWDLAMYEEISQLLHRGFFPVLVHVERFMKYQVYMDAFWRILDLPIGIQINAGSFLQWSQRKKVLELVDKRTCSILGSDCHNLTNRPPNLQKSRRVIEKKMSSHVLERIDGFGTKLLSMEKKSL